MKILFYFFLLTSFIYSQEEIHYVGISGTAPGGANPEFSTLRAACEFLNTRNWDTDMNEKIIITSDITEPAGVILNNSHRSEFIQGNIIITALEGTFPIITFTPFDTTYTQIGFTMETRDVTVSGITFQGDSSSAKNIIPFSISGGGTGQFSHYNSANNCKFYYKSQTVFADSNLFCAVLMGTGQISLNNCIVDADYPGISGYAVGVVSLSAFDVVIQNCEIEARHIGILWGGGSRTSVIKGNKIVLNQISRPLHSYGILEKTTNWSHEIKDNKIQLSKNHYSANSGATGISIRSGGTIDNNTISDFYLCEYKGDSTLTGIEGEFPYNTLLNNTINMNNVFQDFAYYRGVVATRELYMRNNSFNVEENDFPAFVIDFSGTGDGDGGTGDVNSDYNTFNVSEATFIGMYMGVPCYTLEQWQEFTGEDMNSNYIPLRGVSSVANNKPVQYELMQNFPNPFNPTTTIAYSIPDDGVVVMKLYDILGNEIRTLVNENKPAGTYNINLNASELASGTYIYSLSSGGNRLSRKMILIK